MTDRELLELAAKRAGYKHEVSPVDQDPQRPKHWTGWDPLKSDSDAFRLAVKQELSVNVHSTGIVVKDRNGRVTQAWAHPDPYAAARRAIVWAVAEVGRDL